MTFSFFFQNVLLVKKNMSSLNSKICSSEDTSGCLYRGHTCWISLYDHFKWLETVVTNKQTDRQWCLYIKIIIIIIGLFLDDRLKEKLLKPWKKVFSVLTFVCVCLSIHGLQGTSLTQELDFWVEWSLGHEKETHNFVFLNFSFGHFSKLSLYYSSKFLFLSCWSQFFT